jgi:hypothetical protein
MSTRRPSLVQTLTACLLLGGAIGCQPPPEVDDPAPADARYVVDPETGQRYELADGRPVATPAGSDIEEKVSALVTEGVDWSGKVHVQVYSCTTTAPAQHPSLACAVDPSFVVVGGGASVNYGNGPGALLTETRPLNDGQFRQWAAASKDHGESSPHYLTVYAVGLRLDGVARSTLAASMQIKSVTSDKTAHPIAQVTTDEGFLMTGGGARANYTGSGNLLTRSSPALSVVDERTWLVSSKDHKYSDPATITAYVIGIKPAIAGFGTLELKTRQTYGYFFSRQIGNVTQPAESGWLTACAGGLSDYFPGAGRLLTGIIPTVTSAQTTDKDHLVASEGRLYAFERQIRKKP